MPRLTIRDAQASDTLTILNFVKDLARYEKAEHEVKATEAHIESTLFGEKPKVHAVICEQDSQPVGFAVYFYNYSTWLGQNGIYLEDLYVSPESRGSGAGKALLKHIAKIAVENNCGRFEWSVLDWNEPAIQFYQSLGAKPLDEWIGYRLTGDALVQLANS